MKKCWQYQIIFALVSLAAGGLSAILIHNNADAYYALKKPSLSPPGWVFPIVWTGIYILMSAGAGLVLSAPRKANRKPLAIGFYAVQLAANFLWSVLFFKLELYKTAFVWLIFLLFLVIVMTVSFGRVSKWAWVLQLPYIVWLIFAAYLNLSISILNMGL